MDLSEEQTDILAYLMMYRTVKLAAGKMGVTPEYIVSHFADVDFINLCFEAVTSANSLALTKDFDCFFDYAKAEREANKKERESATSSASLNENFGASFPAPAVRKALYRRDFLQPVCLHGYVVGEGMAYGSSSKTRENVIGWKPIEDKYYIHGRDYRLYNPMVQTPALHRVLAEIPAEPDSIQEFCNQYGALWEPWDLFFTGREMDVCPNSLIVHGYELDDYLKEIDRIREATAIFDILASEDYPTIRQFCERPDDLGFKDASGLCLTEDCHNIPPGYLYAHINELLCMLISHGLQQNDVVPEFVIAKHAGPGHFSAAIWDAVARTSDSKEPAFKHDHLMQSDYRLTDPNGMELVYRPMNLAGVAWLMLAYEITGVKTYRQCLACGDWFEIAEMNDNRLSKLYCNGNCRARAYRKRKSSQRNPPKSQITRNLLHN